MGRSQTRPKAVLGANVQRIPKREERDEPKGRLLERLVLRSRLSRRRDQKSFPRLMTESNLGVVDTRIAFIHAEPVGFHTTINAFLRAKGIHCIKKEPLQGDALERRGFPQFQEIILPQSTGALSDLGMKRPLGTGVEQVWRLSEVSESRIGEYPVDGLRQHTPHTARPGKATQCLQPCRYINITIL